MKNIPKYLDVDNAAFAESPLASIKPSSLIYADAAVPKMAQPAPRRIAVGNNVDIVG